jgi:hypothetical protein
MIITAIEAFPLRIPFKTGSKSDASAWGDRNLPAADLRRTSGIPIAAGENVSTLMDFERLLAAKDGGFGSTKPGQEGRRQPVA